MFARRVIAWAALSLALCAAQDLTIAAASDLQFVLPEIVSAFEKQAGKKVRVVYGSSGNFFAQIQNGAPFDLFFSADVDYPRRLEAAGLTRPGSLYLYATGKIVVWTPAGSALDLARLGLQALRPTEVKRIAIANPAHAPYGRAAKAALENSGVYAQVKDRLILGENISQAAQFVQTGNAQAGILALSLALSPRMRSGSYWVVPQDLYPPLEQAAVVVKATKNLSAAEKFMGFVKSDAGVGVLKRFGFVPPERSGPRTGQR